MPVPVGDRQAASIRHRIYNLIVGGRREVKISRELPRLIDVVIVQRSDNGIFA